MTTTKSAAIEINTYRPSHTVIADAGTYFEIKWGFMRVGLARANNAAEAIDAFRALPGIHSYDGAEAIELSGNMVAIKIECDIHADWLLTASAAEASSDYSTLMRGSN